MAVNITHTLALPLHYMTSCTPHPLSLFRSRAHMRTASTWEHSFSPTRIALRTEPPTLTPCLRGCADRLQLLGIARQAAPCCSERPTAIPPGHQGPMEEVRPSSVERAFYIYISQHPPPRQEILSHAYSPTLASSYSPKLPSPQPSAFSFYSHTVDASQLPG